MSSSEETLAEAVHAIEAATFGPAQLRAINAVIFNGRPVHLIQELLARAESGGCGEVQAASEVMRKLEALANVSPVNGIAMIAALVPASSHLRMHEIGDALHLWYVHHKSHDLELQIRAVSASIPDESIRRYLERMLRTAT